jgi:hypothetical protein
MLTIVYSIANDVGHFLVTGRKQMGSCNADSGVAIFIIAMVTAFVVFVIGINWWFVRDARKEKS